MVEEDSGKDTVPFVEATLLKREEGNNLGMQHIEASDGFVGMQTFQFLRCFCSVLRKHPFSRLEEVWDSWDGARGRFWAFWPGWKSSRLGEGLVGALEDPQLCRVSCPAWLKAPPGETASCLFQTDRFQERCHRSPQSFPLGRFVYCSRRQARHGSRCCSQCLSSVSRVRTPQKRRSWSQP